MFFPNPLSQPLSLLTALTFLVAFIPLKNAAVLLHVDDIDRQAFQTVRVLSNAFETVFNRNDVAQVGMFYAEHSTLSMPGAPMVLHGRDAISKAWGDAFTAGGVRGVTLSVDDVRRVDGVAGDGTYLELGHYALSIKMPDGSMAVLKSTYHVWWAIKGSSGEIVRDIINQE